MNQVITLRAHHLLCLQGFQGYGYSKKFVKNMAQIFAKMKSDTSLKIIAKPDDVCSACPHNKNNLCNKNNDAGNSIREFDQEVVRKLDLSIGKRYEAKPLFNRVKKVLNNEVIIEDLCSDCDWVEECLLRK